MKKTLFSLLGSLAVVAGVVSCTTKDQNTIPPVATFGVVHASPDAGNVDVYVGGSLAAQNFAYGSDTGYFAVTPGIYTLQVAPTGTTNFVINTNVTFSPATTYSVFAIDSLSAIKAAVVTDSFTTPSTDSVRVRFFHFSPDAPAVDVAIAGGSTLFSNRTFNDQSTNTSYQSFATLAAGTYNLEVRAAGTSTIVLPVPITLEGGKVYTLYAKGFLTGTGTQALGVGTVVHNQSIQ
ncbi:DUF4397 domain-containing protein [Panacibacter ginsenosidivorans]|uniref:DUF4397 domain-containing protein n=1 Tax=Panacibacter ginsenosidivorans TaxID=1813871 RepID=A0A5B8V486_9BACT|nr:DUF4397 domain-containing protein [Panacibacter ginsenosidivorans]QEC66022.1 DUF4397 domain-containing protein [Panacibacter ginsenosidivorans]